MNILWRCSKNNSAFHSLALNWVLEGETDQGAACLAADTHCKELVVVVKGCLDPALIHTGEIKTLPKICQRFGSALNSTVLFDCGTVQVGYEND